MRPRLQLSVKQGAKLHHLHHEQQSTATRRLPECKLRGLTSCLCPCVFMTSSHHHMMVQLYGYSPLKHATVQQQHHPAPQHSLF